MLLQGFYTEDFLPPPVTSLHLQTLLLCACVCSKNKVGYHTYSHRTCLSHVTETTRREILVHPQLFPWDMFLEVGSTYQRSCTCSMFWFLLTTCCTVCINNISTRNMQRSPHPPLFGAALADVTFLSIFLEVPKTRTFSKDTGTYIMRMFICKTRT